MITFNEQGLISEFKVMIRPLKAIHMVKDKMATALEDEMDRIKKMRNP